MSRFQLVLQSLLYFWKTNLALLLGMTAGTAVITGALIVGDSVRNSLVQTTLERLGKVEYTLHTPRFFRQHLATELNKSDFIQKNKAQVAPALYTTSSLVHSQGENSNRANQVNLYGLEQTGWNLLNNANIVPPAAGEILINARLAQELNAKAGDELSVWIEIPSTIPRESLLGEREETSLEVLYTVREIIPEEVGAGRFAFTPNQQLPRTAFVDLTALQDNLDLSEITPTPRNPEQRPARINSLLVSELAESRSSGGQTQAEINHTLTELQTALQASLQLDDFHLRFQPHEEHQYLSLESEQMFLETPLQPAIQQTANQLNTATSPVLVYLVNEFQNPNNPELFSMYSIVAGVDFTQESPFGPLQFNGEAPAQQLSENEIVINDWLAADLKVKVGDKINLAYHTVGSHGELPEEKRAFNIVGICKLSDSVANDQGFTPTIKGITDTDSFSDWNQPFPMKMERITPRDDEYWENYKATPKAFVSLATAQSLWQSRYGSLTSFRIAPSAEISLSELQPQLESTFLKELNPAQLGLQFAPTKFAGIQAATGTNDFSQLFFGFSFFIILSALVLVSLLFKLNLEQRSSEIGLLAAVGYPLAQVRRQFLSEGTLIIVAGGLMGAALAIGYAALMMYGLKTWWNQAVGTQNLNLHLNVTTLISGTLITAILAALVIWRSLSLLNQLSPARLLGGRIETDSSTIASSHTARISCYSFGVLSSLLLLTGLAGLLPQAEAFGGFSWQVVSFFIVGFGFLISFLAAFQLWLKREETGELQNKGWQALAALAIKNATRHRQRSLLTVLLMSLATFIIVAVAAGRRNPTTELPVLHSGNGGFTLLAESSLPLLYDLNTTAGRQELFLNNEHVSALDHINTFSFRVQPGEEASCLNLYQTKLPTILGVPQAFIDRGGFKFADTPGENPWQALTEKVATNEEAIPVLGDLNTLQYSLHTGLGKQLEMTDLRGEKHSLQIAGMLDGSLFQGVLLMSEANFIKLFPERAGYQYFLFEFKNEADTRSSQLTQILETELTEYGFDVEPVADRIAQFLSVQNTYLSTFQTLGGLGLLLGSFGLATVMLRNVLERSREIALLRAVGISPAGIGWMVLVENGFLMTCGLLSGTCSALLAMSPHLLSTGADFPVESTIIILCSIWIIGTLAALFAVNTAVRTPIISSLRSL